MSGPQGLKALAWCKVTEMVFLQEAGQLRRCIKTELGCTRIASEWGLVGASAEPAELVWYLKS